MLLFFRDGSDWSLIDESGRITAVCKSLKKKELRLSKGHQNIAIFVVAYRLHNCKEEDEDCREKRRMNNEIQKTWSRDE